MEKVPHRVHQLTGQFFNLEGLGDEVEVEEGPDVFLDGGGFDGAGVEPADEELEGSVVGFGEAVGFVLAGFKVLGVEEAVEEGGVVGQEALVQGPVGVLGADVDVHEGGGEESGRWGSGLSEWGLPGILVGEGG